MLRGTTSESLAFRRCWQLLRSCLFFLQIFPTHALVVQAKLFVNKTVGELMFEGYEDPVLQIYSSFGSDEEDEMDSFFEDEETTPAPPKIPMDKFGWFYKVGGFQKLDDGCCRGTGQLGQTGICGCTPARAT